MSKRIQTYISDKNIKLIEGIISNCDLFDYEGNVINNLSAVSAFMIDLGLRVYTASKNKSEFNEKEFKKELFKRILQIVQLNKSVIEIINMLPDFENRNLLQEQFNDNEVYKNWISEEMRKFFNDE